jgi:hypothetical protein
LLWLVIIKISFKNIRCNSFTAIIKFVRILSIFNTFNYKVLWHRIAQIHKVNRTNFQYCLLRSFSIIISSGINNGTILKFLLFIRKHPWDHIKISYLIIYLNQWILSYSIKQFNGQINLLLLVIKDFLVIFPI